ncbi:GDSL-type esterase/lipase family protein [Rhizobium herbae]|uniref:Lysophospholipase L1-like esterase n=1 Tax=Rhizobium herbae TaxID=508661 RepID=A0ABS4ERU4_9HYPH|nr:GDSL-type esterase/lipase family protein [Rhizobium herbae]MBP1860668.1 lysophospholipase L1-like esterase [Rhizobium herbae]
MPVYQSHPSFRRSKYAFLVFITLFACFFIGHQPSHAADACDVYETRVVTTPAPPQWGPTYQRYDAMLAKFPEKADVVLFGDSLAEGWPTESVSSIFPGKAIGNLGVGGDLIQNSLWRLEQMPVSKISPETIVMILGTNNLKARSKPCAIEAGLTKTVEKLHEIWPQAVVYMFTIPPRGKVFNDFEADRQEVNSFIEKMPSQTNYVRSVTGFDDVITCGKRGVDQLQSWFPNYFPDTCANFRGDSLHLTAAGYDVLAGILKQGNN